MATDVALLLFFGTICINALTHSIQVGRKLVYRSEPPVLKRKQKEKDEQKQREEEELQYFFS